MKVKIKTEDPKETEALAARLSQIIKPPSLVLLNGEMGAGKTFFVKAFTEKVGSTSFTSSPTFSIINVYDTPNGPINHLDLYRITDIDELYAIGFDDVLESGGITFIEWPEVAGITHPDYLITINETGETSREFIIEGENPELEGIR